MGIILQSSKCSAIVMTSFSETATGPILEKYILKNSLENTCAEVSFLVKWQAWGKIFERKLQTLFLWDCEIYHVIRSISTWADLQERKSAISALFLVPFCFEWLIFISTKISFSRQVFPLHLLALTLLKLNLYFLIIHN